MYNPTEQFAELNKSNVEQATRLAAIALENTEKLMKLNLATAKNAWAQSVESAQAVASVKDVQDLFALRAKLAEVGRPARALVLAQPVRPRLAGAGRLRRRVRRGVVELHEGRRQLGRDRHEVRAGRFGRRRQRVQVDGRRDDRCVRPVPEGHQAGREPGRRERPRRGGASDEGRPGQGPQGGVTQLPDAPCTMACAWRG